MQMAFASICNTALLSTAVQRYAGATDMLAMQASATRHGCLCRTNVEALHLITADPHSPLIPEHTTAVKQLLHPLKSQAPFNMDPKSISASVRCGALSSDLKQKFHHRHCDCTEFLRGWCADTSPGPSRAAQRFLALPISQQTALRGRTWPRCPQPSACPSASLPASHTRHVSTRCLPSSIRTLW